MKYIFKSNFPLCLINSSQNLCLQYTYGTLVSFKISYILVSFQNFEFSNTQTFTIDITNDRLSSWRWRHKCEVTSSLLKMTKRPTLTRSLPSRRLGDSTEEFSRAFVTGRMSDSAPPTCFPGSMSSAPLTPYFQLPGRCNKARKTLANWADSFLARLAWKLPRRIYKSSQSSDSVPLWTDRPNSK